MAVPSIERPTIKKWLLVVCRCMCRYNSTRHEVSEVSILVVSAATCGERLPATSRKASRSLLFRVKLTVHATAISPSLSQITAYWSKAGDAAPKCHVQPERTAIVMQTSRNTSFGTRFYGLPIRALPTSGKVRCSARGRRRYQT